MDATEPGRIDRHPAARGAELDRARPIAPTRPHPHALDEPPAPAPAGPVAAGYDRPRDPLQGRPRT
ncbi:hypothetical protein LN042_11795 [Kitasatospora sp. RB6PN24]|uniref:hypothetical protein n=1 Tax=Kitasatospora humi TaxID=2893891 RepID=UPI001E60BF43|nr:hypothetical protein [Kitasatospora humi]MCC9307768.1 hypothetical protein [Kitasatospora humi]